MNTVNSNFSSLTKWQKIYVGVLTGLFVFVLGIMLFIIISLIISAGGIGEYLSYRDHKNRSNLTLVLQFVVIIFVLGTVWRNKVYMIFKKEKILEYSDKEFRFYHNVNYQITHPIDFKLISAVARLSINRVRVNFSEVVHQYQHKNYRSGGSIPIAVNEIKIDGNTKDLDQLELTLKNCGLNIEQYPFGPENDDMKDKAKLMITLICLVGFFALIVFFAKTWR